MDARVPVEYGSHYVGVEAQRTETEPELALGEVGATPGMDPGSGELLERAVHGRHAPQLLAGGYASIAFNEDLLDRGRRIRGCAQTILGVVSRSKLMRQARHGSDAAATPRPAPTGAGRALRAGLAVHNR